MNLDRSLQNELLTKLADCFPYACLDIFQDVEDGSEQDRKLIANLLYLEAHGLIAAGIHRGVDNHVAFSGASITAKGLDFIADDGGLSAIFRVVMIRLHDESIRELVALRINESHLAPEDKKSWLDALRSLPADATKHLTMKLLELGLQHGPDAFHAIQTYIGK